MASDRDSEGPMQSDLNEDTKRLLTGLETELGRLRWMRSHEDTSAIEELKQIVDELGVTMQGIPGLIRLPRDAILA